MIEFIINSVHNKLVIQTSMPSRRVLAHNARVLARNKQAKVINDFQVRTLASEDLYWLLSKPSQYLQTAMRTDVMQ